MKRTMTSRDRLSTFANVSRVQSEQETYDMAVSRDVELKRQRERAKRAEAERDEWRSLASDEFDRLAAVEAERDILRGLLQEWVDPEIDGISREELIRQSFAAIKGYHDNLK